MRKVIIILSIAVFISACSVFRTLPESASADEKLRSMNITEALQYQNVTNSDFYIQKADIEIISDKEKTKLTGSIKFLKTGKFLISLRSRTGIEGARILISKDTILINDRLNRKLYCGKPVYLKKKYGIPASVIPVLLGDYVSDNKRDKEDIKCLGGNSTVDGYSNGLKIRYDIDCSRGKSLRAVFEGNTEGEGTEIKYGNFVRIAGIFTPRKISIQDSQTGFNIYIRVIKIEYPWTGDIEFIPGRNYEIIKVI